MYAHSFKIKLVISSFSEISVFWLITLLVQRNLAILMMPQSQNYNFGSCRPQICNFFARVPQNEYPLHPPFKKKTHPRPLYNWSCISYNLTEYLHFYRMQTFKTSCRKVKISISPWGGNFQFSAQGEWYVCLKKISPRGEFSHQIEFHLVYV